MRGVEIDCTEVKVLLLKKLKGAGAVRLILVDGKVRLRFTYKNKDYTYDREKGEPMPKFIRRTAAAVLEAHGRVKDATLLQ